MAGDTTNDAASEQRPFPEPDRATFFEVNRTRLRAWCWGDEDAPPVLLVHGGHDHGRMWDDFAPRVAELGFHAIAVDLRGHGDSGRLSSGMIWSASTIDLCELARILARTPGEPIGMIGHSMGGGQVLTAAATTPERVAWVVNIDGLGPPAEAFTEIDIVEMATRSIDAIVKVSSRPPRVWASLDEMARRRGEINFRLPRRHLDHLVAHGTVEVPGPDGGTGFVWKSDPWLAIGIPDGFTLEMITASFADVAAPVLALMASEEDTWSDLDDDEIGRRIKMFPDARWTTVPGAGHYVHVEQPDRVLTEIAAFLTDIGVLDGAQP